MVDTHEHDPLEPHSHDPNPEPPSPDATFTLHTPDGDTFAVTVDALRALPTAQAPNCYIVSTGHGTSGPFTFAGVRLLDLVVHYVPGPWTQAEVVSADGFGNRVYREELEKVDPDGPILMAHTVDGEPMAREQGLVRLIVPSEKDDALRQVKWVGQINVRNSEEGAASAQ